MNHRSAKFLHEVKKLTVDWRARLCHTHGLPVPQELAAITLDRNASDENPHSFLKATS